MMNREVLGNRYEVQQQLGKKSGRRTLLARDRVTDNLVIVKLLAFGSDFEWDDLKLFEREAQTLKSLSHPSIPQYLDYFEVKSANYQGFALIQSHIPAKTLEQYLQNGRTFTESEVKEIAKAVLEILIYLHELHPPVIHRDIKPSNILLGERSGNSVGKVYLVDFGSVQTILAAETGTRTVVGTYGYMPQEQFGGRTVPVSDLYSLGATLIYLITGTQPSDLPQKNFRIQFEQVANLSPSLTNWLKKMIEPSVEKRFSSAKSALTSLETPTISDVKTLNISKPVTSKINITKNDNSLEIVIPTIGFDDSIIFSILFITCWHFGGFYWLLNQGNSDIKFLFTVFFSLPFWGLGLLMIYGILYYVFGNFSIHIDAKQMSLSHQFGKFKIPRSSYPKMKIHKLVYNAKSFYQDSDGNKAQLPPKLVIWAGLKTFDLVVTTMTIKSQEELEWIATELSIWLGIPLEIE